MILKCTVDCKNNELKNKYQSEIGTILSQWFQIEWGDVDLAQVEFVTDPGGTSTDRSLTHPRLRIQIVNESYLISSKVFSEHHVDDFIVYPFRATEVFSKMRLYDRILAWSEVESIEKSLSEMMDKWHDDVGLTERVFKAMLPSRFPDIKGLKVTSRYLAGEKSGGDYFDLSESVKGTQIGMLMTDSSSYGLSSRLASIIVKVGSKLTLDETKTSQDFVKKIETELLTALGPKDQLSLFYGVLSRSTLDFNYVNLGSSLILCERSGQYQKLPKQGPAISQNLVPNAELSNRIDLLPKDRLFIFSDGFVEALGEDHLINGVLKTKSDPVDMLNEISFQVKKDLAEDNLPAQDCSALIVEIDKVGLKIVSQLS